VAASMDMPQRAGHEKVRSSDESEGSGGGGATRSLQRDGGVEELHGDQTHRSQ